MSSSHRNRADGQQATANGRLDGHRNETERYRQAADDALQQLDWCIGYLHGIRKARIARALAHTRTVIRTQLLKRPEQPLPNQPHRRLARSIPPPVPARPRDSSFGR